MSKLKGIKYENSSTLRLKNQYLNSILISIYYHSPSKGNRHSFAIEYPFNIKVNTYQLSASNSV